MSKFSKDDYDKFDAAAKKKCVQSLPTIFYRYYGKDYYVVEREEDYGWDLEVRNGWSDDVVCYCDAKVKAAWNVTAWPREWEHIHVEDRLKKVIENGGVDPKTGKVVTLAYWNYHLTALVFIDHLGTPALTEVVSNRRCPDGEAFYLYTVRQHPFDLYAEGDGLHAHYHLLEGSSPPPISE